MFSSFIRSFPRELTLFCRVKLVSSESSGILCVWDVEEAELLARFEIPTQASLYSIAVAHKEQSSKGDDYVNLYALVDNRVHVYTLPSTRAGYASMDPLQVSILQPNNAKPLFGVSKQDTKHDSRCDMRITPDASFMVVMAGGAVNMLSAKGKDKPYKQLFTQKGEYNAVAIVSNEEGPMVAYCNKPGPEKHLDDGKIHLMTAQGKKVVLHWHPTYVNHLEFSSQGEYLYSAGGEGVIVLWNLSTMKRNVYQCGAIISKFVVNDTHDRIVATTTNTRLVILEPTRIESNLATKSISFLQPPLNPSAPFNLIAEPRNSNLLITGSQTVQWYDIYDETYVSRIIILCIYVVSCVNS